MRIRFTPSARDQFLAAINYIQRDKPMAARRFRKRSETALRRLVRFPQSGRKVPEFPIVVLPADIEELPENRLQSLADATLPELIEKLTTQ